MNIVDFFNKQNSGVATVKESVSVEDNPRVVREVKMARFAGHKLTFSERFTENVIAEYVANIVYKATPLGEEFKQEFRDAIFKRTTEIVKETVDIKAVINNPGTAMHKVVVAYGESVAMGILREVKAKSTPDDTDLEKMDSAELSKDDKLGVEDLTNRLHGDDVAEIINTKTIEVINDESERASKRQEDLENIKTETAPEDEEPELEPEDANSGDEELEESLFGALCKRSAMQSIKESTDGKIAETAMAEAIMEYVVYETLNTLRFVNLDSETVKEFMGARFDNPERFGKNADGKFGTEQGPKKSSGPNIRGLEPSDKKPVLNYEPIAVTLARREKEAKDKRK